MNRRSGASGRHITSPRCGSVPMVNDWAPAHDGAHDRHESSRAAEERSKGSARRHPRVCAGRARRGPHRRAPHPRKPGTTWRRKLRIGPRRQARIPGRCAIRPRNTAIGWGHNSTGRRSRFARGCSRADDRWTRRWLTERVPCGIQRWRCAHGSSSPAAAGSNWRPVSSGSSRRQSDRFLRAPSPCPFRDGRSWKRKRAYAASRPVCATNGRCMREGWRCCRGCSAMAAGPRTTRMPEARCARRSERSPLRLTVNGVHDGRREGARFGIGALGYHVASFDESRAIGSPSRHGGWVRLRLPTGLTGPIERDRIRS
jgi:hypothetical protein